MSAGTGACRSPAWALAAALGIGGYVIGASKGRKEGIEEGIKEGYQQGYWTLNPDLHSDNPEP
jgi:hypothetical protein